MDGNRNGNVEKLDTHAGSGDGASPWTLGLRVKFLAWEFVWAALCAWTPKPLNPWRLAVLRLFGATIEGRPFVHQRARIQFPWNLTLRNMACLGDGANLYTLGKIEIGARAIIAQEAYLSTGTHDFGDLSVPLQTAPIRVGEYAFVAARAFVMPGVSIGARTVVGACSVVTKDLPDDVICAGNPCRVLKAREIRK